MEKNGVECFLEMLPDNNTTRSNIKVQKGKSNYKFGTRKVLPLLSKRILLCTLAGIRVNTEMGLRGISLTTLLCKDSMMRKKTRNDTINILR